MGNFTQELVKALASGEGFSFESTVKETVGRATIFLHNGPFGASCFPDKQKAALPL
ncbi:MAG: hypothetical protein ACI32C_03830 [Candidatus Enteromonas sp.]